MTEQINESQKSFTLKSLAEYLQLNYDSVRRMVRQGRIPPPDVKISRFPRWKRQTIVALINTGRI